MTVLVTGANGFLGTSLVEKLAENGEKSIRCFLREGGNQKRLEDIIRRYPDTRIELFYGTLSSIDDCRKAIVDIEKIYHLAGTFSGAIADMFYNTVVATKNLFDAFTPENCKLPIIFISSFSVYGVSNQRAGYTINEESPLETNPTLRDPYSFVKTFQEKMVLDYQKKYGFPLAILRPGVIYGPHGGGVMSGRVGVSIGNLFLHLGGNNLIPLSYVENCADAIICAGNNISDGVEIFNVHDNDLPTSKHYLKEYKKSIRKIRSIRIPYFLLQIISRIVKWYHVYSNGQLPDIFTPYKSAAMWKGNKFDNSKLRSIGWEQKVSTREGMNLTFEGHKSSA